MNRPILAIALLAMFASLIGSCSETKEQKSSNGPSSSSEPKLEYTRSVAFIDSHSSLDTVAVIDVAVAKTQMETNQGLMNVKNLPADKGMLFIFDNEELRSFWMANTPLPLDIIFVNKSKNIVRIHHSAQPYSQKQYKSGQPAQYVIETNGGFCINNDIREGMKVSF